MHQSRLKTDAAMDELPLHLPFCRCDRAFPYFFCLRSAVLDLARWFVLLQIFVTIASVEGAVAIHMGHVHGGAGFRGSKGFDFLG